MIKLLGITSKVHVFEFVEVDGCGDIAYARGNWLEEYSMEGVEEPHKDEGKVLGILRRQSDGSWLIAVWFWNSDLPSSE